MKLIFATHNINKLVEIQSLIPKNIELLSLTDIGCHDEIPETADTIEGNARQKALYVKENFGYDGFADDTGLEVEVLNGKPGVFSARYAGEDKKDADNIKKLLKNLSGKTNRQARFKTVICLVWGGKEYFFEGICRGKIIEEKRGEEGFGYDPIFVPEGQEKTFAEMQLSEKNSFSHRGKAVKKLIAFLKKQ